jgi:hypothetical protein
MRAKRAVWALKDVVFGDLLLIKYKLLLWLFWLLLQRRVLLDGLFEERQRGNGGSK